MKTRRALIDFFELFYPKFCAGCKGPLNSAERALCFQCKFNLNKNGFHDISGNPIEKRFWGKVNIEAATSFAKYIKNGILQNAIYDLKYANNKDVGIELGNELAYALKASVRFRDIDIILPVPLHKAKKRKRGFNQCDLIAEGISDILKIEWSDEYLKRVKFNKSQTGKSTFMRNKNTEGIFKTYNEKYLEEKRVLIIDDVITTGATLESCIKAMENIKGIEIFVATIANA